MNSKKLIIILFLLFIIVEYYKINVTKTDKKNKTVAIGIITGSLSYGGVDRYISLFLNSMAEKTNYKIICLGTKKSNAKFKINDKVIFLAENGLPKNITEFDKLVKDYNIKYLIYNLIDEYGANYLTKLNTKIIGIFHGIFIGNFYDKNCFSQLLPLFYLGRKYVAIVGIAPYDYYIFEKYFNNSVSIPNFITFDEKGISELAKLDNHEIVMIGRANSYVKNFEMGYRAFAEILKEIPDATLKIISKTDGLDYLKNLANDLNITNNIKYTGYLSDPKEELKKSSLLLYTSKIEGFGLALVEGRGVGLPVITNGINYTYTSLEGIINCEVDDYKDMAKKAVYILKNYSLRKKLGKLSKKKLYKFSNKYTVRRWLELFNAIDNNEFKGLREKFKKIDGYNEDKAKLINEYILNITINRFPKEYECIKLNDLLNETFLKSINYCNQ